MRVSAFVAAATLSLVGCAVPADLKQVPKTADDDAMIQRALMNSLNDPRSAQIEAVAVFATDSGERIRCGKINAKNAFGGYIGFQTFLVTTVPAVDYSSPYAWPIFAMGAVAQIDCGRAGYR